MQYTITPTGGLWICTVSGVHCHFYWGLSDRELGVGLSEHRTTPMGEFLTLLRLLDQEKLFNKLLLGIIIYVSPLVFV